MSFDESREDIQCKISKQLRGRGTWQLQLMTFAVVLMLKISKEIILTAEMNKKKQMQIEVHLFVAFFLPVCEYIRIYKFFYTVMREILVQKHSLQKSD